MARRITEPRNCCFYWPFITPFSVCVEIAFLGVWVNWTLLSRDDTSTGLSQLGATLNGSSDDLGRVQPAVIATAVFCMVWVCLLFALAVWRAFIQATHDYTGLPSDSSTVFLVLQALASVGWFCFTLWLGLLCCATVFWLTRVDDIKDTATAAIVLSAQYGQGVWAPSSNAVCPGQCLNLRQMTYLNATTPQAVCVCNTTQLRTVAATMDDAENNLTLVLVFVWVMLLAALWLLMDAAAMFAATKAEREYLHRLRDQAFDVQGGRSMLLRG